MGEYMTVVNLDKKEYFSIAPLKFWEQIANQMVPIAIYWLVTHRHDNIGFGWDGAQEYPTLGRWAGDRIIVIGDYDQEYEWIFEKMDEGEFKNITVEICRDLAKWCKENGLEELAAMYECTGLRDVHGVQRAKGPSPGGMYLEDHSERPWMASQGL